MKEYMNLFLKYRLLYISIFVVLGTFLIPFNLFSADTKKNVDPEVLRFAPKWNEEGTTLRHTWEGLGNVDQFRWFIRRDMQDQLQQAHQDLNLKHIRAVGMFDDELRVFALDPQTWREKDRIPRYNWQIVDYVIQSLLDRGINPMITTSFMPEDMASGKQYCFTTRANVTPPKDYKQWTDLISNTVRHFVDRFGENTVKNWYFEVWNEPNLDAFWKDADKKEFFKIYETTYRAIKSVNPTFKVGGPSAARAEWIKEFIEYGRENSCPSDYIIAHVYNNDSENAPLSPFAGSQSDKINQSPNFLPGVVKGTRKLLDDLGYKGELHFNEWGRSWFPVDAIRESQNEAAFIVKSMAECSQYADYFAYWCLSDIYDQMGYGAETFHGNYGMISLDGLKKPSYKAFQLLGKLGDRQVSVNNPNDNVLKNAIATKSKDGYQFLFYAFEKDFIPDSTIVKKITVSILLPNNFNADKIKIYQIGNSENNILYEWKKMNKPAYLKKDELVKLSGHNALQKYEGVLNIENTQEGKVLIFETESPGVAFVELEAEK
jgi:xylan 1,4-beta-xylosidase